MADNSAQRGIQTVEAFIAHVEAIEKTAAEANTEPGSIGGPTKHPSKNVEDHTRPATEGFRSAENTKDVKEELGKPSVDSTPEAKAAAALDTLVGRFTPVKAAEGVVSGSAAADQLQIGTNKQPTGEDPKNETASAKGGKEDSQTTHPARTDNTELGGGKYAVDANASLDKLAADMQAWGDQLCASMAVVGHDAKQLKVAQAAGTQVVGTVQETSKQASVDDAWLASQVGWEMAGLVTGRLDKRAADVLVHSTIKEVVKLANDRADRVIRFMAPESQATVQKAAEGGMPPEGAGGGVPPSGAGDEATLAALGGAAEGGGAPGGGGMPPEAGGGGGGEEAQLMQLLQQLGITPEQLVQMLSQVGQEGGGAGGGMPPPGAGGGMPPDAAAGGMPPPGAGGGGMPPPGAGGMPPPEVGKAAGDKAANMRDYLIELVQRSQRKAG